MLIINKYSRLDPFEVFKDTVKCVLGEQLFSSRDYSMRIASGNLYTVCFTKHTNMSINSLSRAWKYIYSELLAKDLGDPNYIPDVIPSPCIHDRTLIFKIEYKK